MSKLTDASVKNYTAGAKRREIPDRGSSLILVVQPKPKGTKSWAMRFRRDGRPAKLTLGRVQLPGVEPDDDPALSGTLTLAQARELAAKIDRDRARGIDVIEEHKAERSRRATAAVTAAADSFGALAREFFIDHRTKRHTRPRHWRADARLLGLDYPRDCDLDKTDPVSHLPPAPKVIVGSLAETWADKPVADIDGHDIHAVVDGARRLGIPGLPKHARGVSESRGRKMHATLSNLFRWALSNRKVTINPCTGVAHPGAPPARERVLIKPATSEGRGDYRDVRLFWRACDQLGPPYGLLFQFLLLTGQRLGEVAGMTRAELSEDGTLWTLAGNRTKNHRAHLVPLSPLARTIIERVTRVENPHGYVFTIGGKRLTGFSRAKGELDQEMSASAGAPVEPWRLHDLRRSAATGMVELGVLPHVVEAVLNHVSGAKAGVAGVYNRSVMLPERKAALERWATHIEGVVTGRSNVFPMLRPST